jgi:phosphoenolpyruvate carboxykinase (GTP)
MHTVGAPLAPGQKDVPGPATTTKYIVHFPETREIWSYGSGYGGNALLGKKCFALRIASNIARDEGWMAEHMLILGVESPKGEEDLRRRRLPLACGKTNFAMLIPPDGFDGWKVWTVGDDIAWIKPDANGQLRAINPEAGFFGVAPGTSEQDQPQRHGHAGAATPSSPTSRSPRGRRLVGGHDRRAARRLPRLARQRLDARDRQGDRRQAAAHPNGRFTAPASSARPSIRWEDPRRRAHLGAFIFGGRRPPPCRSSIRRSTGPPASTSARRWARRPPPPPAAHRQGAPRPHGDAALLRLQHGRLLPALAQDAAQLSVTPRVFHVNWFRKDADGKFLWPGFAKTCACSSGSSTACAAAQGKETPIGWTPHFEDINWKGSA